MVVVVVVILSKKTKADFALKCGTFPVMHFVDNSACTLGPVYNMQT